MKRKLTKVTKVPKYDTGGNIPAGMSEEDYAFYLQQMNQAPQTMSPDMLTGAPITLNTNQYSNNFQPTPAVAASQQTARTSKGFNANVNLNTSGLITGANALVTNFLYNPQVRRSEAARLRGLMAPIQGYIGDTGSDDNRFYANGGTIQSTWNDFADWVSTQKVSNKSNRTQSLIDQYNALTGANISTDLIKQVQSDFKNDESYTGTKSRVDGWLGTATGAYRYPVQSVQSPIKSLSYEKLYDADKNMSYSPVFNGNWTANAVAQQWQDIPESINNVPVHRGDSWKEGWKGYRPGTTSNSWTKVNSAPVQQPIYDGVRLATGSSYAKGGMVDYTTAPWLANAVVESGEVIQTPDDVTTPIYGDTHDDASGGEYINVPDGTKVYSDRVKVDKDFASELTGTKIKKKLTVAQLAKKFDTSKEEEILKSKADPIAKRTAAIMKETKNVKLNQLFDYQESDNNTGVYASGGSIHINPANKGKFTAAAERAGMGVQEYARKVLSDPDASPALKKRANFARNAASWSHANGGSIFSQASEYLPEAIAAVNNMSDFPIFSARYNPLLLPEAPQLGISSQLDRNYAQTQAVLGASSGNQSVDLARGAQALSNLYDANNQVYGQKYNADMQTRYQTDATNTQIMNQAALTNLQRADQFWDKVTARKANKDATNNAIANSVYAKSKAKRYEQTSINLLNELYPNYRYNQGAQGFEYVTDSKGNKFVIPSSIGNNSRFMPDDGIRSSETIKLPNGRIIKRSEDHRNGY